MGKDGRGRPNLDEYLINRRGAYGPCKYVRLVPEELRAEITARVVEQQIRAWSSYVKWLTDCGIDGIVPSTIEYHYSQKHEADR